MASQRGRDFRDEALLAAASSLPVDQRERLLHRHPRSAMLVEAMQACPSMELSELVWEELAVCEARLLKDPGVSGGLDSCNAVTYWQRRRQLCRLDAWRQIVATLPGYWQTLLEADAEGIKRQCVRLGMEMIRGLMWGKGRDALATDLAILGRSLASQVVERLAQPTEAPCSPQVACAWHNAYKLVVKYRRGVDIPSVMGRTLLATLFGRLSDSQRSAAIEVARSNMCSVLASTHPLELSDAQQLDWLEQMVTEYLHRPDGMVIESRGDDV